MVRATYWRIFLAPEISFPGNGDRSPQRLGSNGQLSVDTVLMEDLPLIEGDCVRLQQVMLNLINNAVQAMRSVESRKLLMRSSRTDSNEIVFLVSRRSISAKSACRFRISVSRVTQRMAMAEMAASIVHEINQPSAAVAANANEALRLLAGSDPDLDEARAALRRIVNDSRHVNELKAQINKADRNDARGIAQMMRAGLYRPVPDRSENYSDLAIPPPAIAAGPRADPIDDFAVTAALPCCTLLNRHLVVDR